MPFSPNQVLIAPADLKSPTDIKTLAGTVASKLGAKFKDVYKHTRPVALTFSKAEKLTDSKKLKDKAGLKWSVAVDGKVKEILFRVHEGTKVLDEATIFAKFDDIVDGTIVISLDSADATVDTLAKRVKGSLDGNYAKDGKADKKVDLAPINKKKKIVLVGHGGGPDVTGDAKYTASEFGGRTAKSIVDFLIDKGLSTSYAGTIYLCGCHTASGGSDPKSFANQVHKLFASEGYKKLTVAGTPGLTSVKDDGGTMAIPDSIGEDLKKTHAKSKAMIEKLEKALKSGKDELATAEHQMKLMEDQYASAREMIVDLPPETHKTLEDKLLLPIKKSRDELVPAVHEMRRANKLLEGAVEKEKKYFKTLDSLLKDKKKWETGQIDTATYRQKQMDVFTVDDWWGHFGPAKATTAKVKKSGDTFGGLIKAFKAKFKKG